VCREAMMRVVKEQRETALLTPVVANALDQSGLIPLVNDDELRVVKHFVEFELLEVVADGLELWISVVEIKQRLWTMLGN
jgi:hypothetical protein